MQGPMAGRTLPGSPDDTTHVLPALTELEVYGAKKTDSACKTMDGGDTPVPFESLPPFPQVRVRWCH